MPEARKPCAGNRWADSFIIDSKFGAIFFIKGHRFVKEAEIHNRWAYDIEMIHHEDGAYVEFVRTYWLMGEIGNRSCTMVQQKNAMYITLWLLLKI